MINLFIYRKNISNIYKKFRKSVPKIIYFIKKYNKNQLNLNPRVMQPNMKSEFDWTDEIFCTSLLTNLLFKILLTFEFILHSVHY